MSDQQMIEAIAKALAAARNHSEASTNDREFATKFVIAYRAMAVLNPVRTV